MVQHRDREGQRRGESKGPQRIYPTKNKRRTTKKKLNKDPLKAASADEYVNLPTGGEWTFAPEGNSRLPKEGSERPAKS